MVNTTDYQHDYMEKVKKLNWLGKGKQQKVFSISQKKNCKFLLRVDAMIDLGQC